MLVPYLCFKIWPTYLWIHMHELVLLDSYMARLRARCVLTNSHSTKWWYWMSIMRSFESKCWSYKEFPVLSLSNHMVGWFWCTFGWIEMHDLQMKEVKQPLILKGHGDHYTVVNIINTCIAKFTIPNSYIHVNEPLLHELSHVKEKTHIYWEVETKSALNVVHTKPRRCTKWMLIVPYL